MSQFKLSTNIQLPDSICRFPKICLRNLKINNLKLKIYNISYILDLNSLPYSTCSLLSLSNISSEDLVGIINALRKKKDEESILKHLKLKFNYSLYININTIDDMFRNYSFPLTIAYITMRFKNEFSTNEYYEIMWKIINALANSENNPKELKVTIKLYYDEDDDPISFFNLKQNLTNCFDFDKLNPNYLLTYNFNFREIKSNKEKDENKQNKISYGLSSDGNNNFIVNEENKLQSSNSNIISLSDDEDMNSHIGKKIPQCTGETIFSKNLFNDDNISRNSNNNINNKRKKDNEDDGNKKVPFTF